jgi:hypothetical protein
MLSVPFVLVTSVATSSAPDLASWGVWLLVNLAAVAATVPAVFLARWARPRHAQRVVPLPVTMLVGALVGAVKGVTTSAFAAMANLIDDPFTDAVGRSVNTAVIGAALIPSLAALMAARDRWNDERSLLMVELVRRSLDAQGREASQHRQTLRLIADQTRSDLASQQSPSWPTTIRTMVDQQLRPLSAEVLAASRMPPVSAGGALLRVVLMREPLAIGIITALFALSSAVLMVRHGDVVPVLGYGASLAVVTGSTLWLAQWSRARWPAMSWVWLVAALGAVATAQRPLGRSFVGVVDELDHVGVTVISAVWLAELVVATTMITAARREQGVIRERLLWLLGPEGVRDAVGHGVRAIDGREFAFFIHGHLQNRLLALADRLDHGDATSDSMQEVMDVLSTASEPCGASTSVRERLHEIAQRWRGVADIEVMLPNDVDDFEPNLADRIVHVVVEAVNNSVRHGAARDVTVQVEVEGSSSTITVTDDGFGPRRGRSGVGSHYFDLVSGGEWSLTSAAAGGAVLRVPLAPDAANVTRP